MTNKGTRFDWTGVLEINFFYLIFNHSFYIKNKKAYGNGEVRFFADSYKKDILKRFKDLRILFRIYILPLSDEVGNLIFSFWNVLF